MSRRLLVSAVVATTLVFAAVERAGAFGGSRSPEGTAGQARSTAVFPEQHIALRFDHTQHIDLGMKCVQCHENAPKSEAPSDLLVPPEAKCGECHDIEAAKQGKKTDPPSSCATCHPGFDFTIQKVPPRDDFPTAHLKFSHQKHLSRGTPCAACHGAFDKVTLASRGQLPKMASCLACHDGHGAPMACETCHFTKSSAIGSRVETRYDSGSLRPDAHNPFGLDHGSSYERTHALVATARRSQCMACHAETECKQCHDGTTKPMGVHPNDWLTIHPVPAKMDEPRCDACHRRQSFCISCHERTGVGKNADAPFRQLNVRVHPPTDIWVGRIDASGAIQVGSGHHAVQAARNIGNCASCHREEECVQCHSASTTLTKPIPPFTSESIPHYTVHPPDFKNRCRSMVRANPRACEKCHTLSPADSIGPCL